MFDYIYDSIIIHMLVFARLAAILFFNPILGRNNAPSQWKVGYALVIACVVVPTLNTSNIVFESDFAIFFALANELMFGFVVNYIFVLFYYMIFFAGDLLDFNFGLSMAKIFDPATNIQMSLTGNLFTIFFSVYFFVTDCHLLLIKIITSSFTLVQIGGIFRPEFLTQFMIEAFLLTLTILLRLIAPFMVLQFIVEVTLGILMKLIPQIHVFVLNMQIKLLLGFTLLIVFSQNIMTILNEYMQRLFLALQEVMTMF